MTYICIGAPYFLGEHLPQRTEVESIEKTGIAGELGIPWINVQPDFDHAPDPITAVNRAIAQVITDHKDRIPLIFSSDCSLALGTVKGLGNSAILWLDAHGDFNTDETSPSGFLGGMPLAMLVGRGNMTYMKHLDLEPIPEAHVIITDARDLDPEEKTALESSKVTWLKDIDMLFNTPLMQKPYYIHFDLDVIDMEELPGMNYPTSNGTTVETCKRIIAYVKAQTQIAGVLFSLWNDGLPTEGKSLAATLELIRAVTS